MNKVEHDYEVIFVDVGQGDATLVRQLSNMNSVLIDAGVANPVLSVLKRGAELEGIFITHWDKDHIGGMPSIIRWLSNQNQKAVEIYVNRQPQSTDISKRLSKTLDEARESGTIILKMAYKEFPGQVPLIGGIFLFYGPFMKLRYCIQMTGILTH